MVGRRDEANAHAGGATARRSTQAKRAAAATTPDEPCKQRGGVLRLREEDGEESPPRGRWEEKTGARGGRVQSGGGLGYSRLTRMLSRWKSWLALFQSDCLASRTGSSGVSIPAAAAPSLRATTMDTTGHHSARANNTRGTHHTHTHSRAESTTAPAHKHTRGSETEDAELRRPASSSVVIQRNGLPKGTAARSFSRNHPHRGRLNPPPPALSFRRKPT